MLDRDTGVGRGMCGGRVLVVRSRLHRLSYPPLLHLSQLLGRHRRVRPVYAQRVHVVYVHVEVAVHRERRQRDLDATHVEHLRRVAGGAGGVIGARGGARGGGAECSRQRRRCSP